MAESIVDLGWEPIGFAKRLETRYVVQDRGTGRFVHYGQLLKRSPPIQRFYTLVIKRLKQGGPVRIIVLKGRKAGISTATAVLLYDIVTHVEGMKAGVLAHKQESTDVLFDMVKGLWDHTDKALRPHIAKRNGTMIKFGARYVEEIDDGDMGLQSAYECATAGGENPFSGDSPRFVHLSEGGKMPGDKIRQKNLITSVFNSVPSNGPSLIIEEGTAQGMDNQFHEAWKIAEANVENDREPLAGELIPFFLSAQEDPLNRMAVDPAYNWYNWPEDDRIKEELLKERYKVNREFLMWRRWKVKEIGMDFDKFDEEYPVSPEVAFLASGRPAIPRHMMDILQSGTIKPLQSYRSSLVEVGPNEAFGSAAINGW